MEQPALLIEVGVVIVVWLLLRLGYRYWRSLQPAPKLDPEANAVSLSRATIDALALAAERAYERVVEDDDGSHLMFKTERGGYIAVPAEQAVLEHADNIHSVIVGQSEWRLKTGDALRIHPEDFRDLVAKFRAAEKGT